MDLQKLILRVGKYYLQSSKELKKCIGQVLEGKIKLGGKIK